MLNSRETAVLIWLGVVFLASLWKRELRQGLGRVLTSLLKPVILLPLLCMIAYIGLELWIGTRLSLWHRGLTKATVIWAGGSALVLYFNCTKVGEKRHFFRNIAAGTIAIIVFVEFFMNLVVLSLPLELLLQPLLVGLALLSAVASTKPEHRPVKAMGDGILALVGFLLAGYIAYELYAGWRELDEAGLALEFALPIWLTIGLLPFIYVLSLYVGYYVVLSYNQKLWIAEMSWAAYPSLETKHRRGDSRGKGDVIRC